ncbi:MAG: AAA family ATPase [Verrucomicrobia bacterium]|nr:AAA family ATPase [Verrucomicrobiota bacterium]
MSFVPGLVLNERYEIRAALPPAQGRCAYRALDLRLGRDARIQAFDLPPDAGDLPALDRRTHGLAGLQHAQIRSFQDVGMLRREGYMVTPWLSGFTLAELAPLPAVRLRGWVQPAASALAAAHTKGIVHGALDETCLLEVPGLGVLLQDFALPLPGGDPAEDLKALGRMLSRSLADAPDGEASRDGEAQAESVKRKKPSEPLVRFYSPSELRAYEPPPNQNMIGDFHLQRGAPSVLAGPPGCGKSRAALWLGIMGARGVGDWFGMPVHCQFRTLILQNENGLTRLHRDFAEIPPVEGLDDWLKISAPPTYGLALQNPMFRNELKAMMKDFAPNLLIVDPWNACVRDAMEKDFQEGFSRLREVLAESPSEPACLILHHLRKPKSDDRHRGRNLANLLSGSYVLVGVARSVLVMQPATDDTEDARVVVTCAKNNDGSLGARSAWERREGMFHAVEHFDFEAFDSGGPRQEPKVNEGHLRELFEQGRRWCALKQAVESLEEIACVGRSAAYEALKLERGRFSHLLMKSPATGFIGLKQHDGEPMADDESDSL